MRWLLIVLLAWGLGAGCASRTAEVSGEPSDAFPVAPKSTRQKPSTPKSPRRSSPPLPASHLSTTNDNTILTLTDPATGRVASVNALLRYVILDFSLRKLPALDQRLGVYRQGQKVGEVKITGPERGGNIVADLVAGEVKPGDEVRSD